MNAKAAPRPKIDELYVAALEALEVVARCKPGLCDLSPADRRAAREAAGEIVLAFIRAKTKNKDWLAKQDAVLKALGDHV